jgi:RNA polymerase sigma-70 factor (ECF subfamily)
MRQHAREMPVPDRAEEEQRWSAAMARARAGNPEAYAELMAELADVVEAYLRVRFGAVRDSDFLEDCVQEALLALHRVRHTWDPRRPFRPWMFAVVRHKVIDLLRRREVRRSEPDPSERAAEPGRDPAQRLDGARLLEALEPGEREALVLTKLEGYSLEEAAARAGVSLAAMKSRVHRAVQRVQKRLREEDLA